MKLHRLLLQDFRGVAHREIRFPDTGVVVLAGPNEVGKSSLVEALDLLLHERASATKAAVRAIQPVGRDVGSVVEAELTLGPVRLVYRKQWNRGTATQLDLLSPVREQLTGRPAHERMTALLGDHLDAELYQAQRVLQAGRTGATWTAAGSLTAALDEAVGRAVAQESGEDLVTAVEREYRELFTATGRPTGALKQAQADLRSAEAAAVQARAALAEIDARAADHAAVQARVTSLTADLAADTELLAALQTRRDTLLALTAALERAEQDAAAAVAPRDAAAISHRERAAAIDRIDVLTAELGRLGAESARLRAELAPAEAQAAQHATLVAEAQQQSVAADAAAAAARLEADRQADLAEWHELQSVLVAVDSATAAADAARAELRLLRVGAEELAAVEKARRLLEVAVAAAETAAPRIDVELETPDVVLTLDGRPVTEVVGLPVTDELTLALPGIARITIGPAAGADELRRRVRQATAELDRLLRELDAEDVAAVRAQAARHRVVSAELDRAEAGLAGLTGRRSRQALLDRCAVVQAGFGTPTAPPVGADPVDHREPARAAERAAAELRAGWQARAADLDAVADRVRSLRGDLATCETTTAVVAEHLAAARADLERQRRDRTDAELSARLLQTQDLVDTSRGAATAARAAHEAAAEPGLSAAIGTADQAHRRRLLDRAAAERTLVALTTELEIIGSQGRQEQVDLAESALLVATRQSAAVAARAEAVSVLREVLHRHRDQARARYVAPFQQAVVRLGRRWLGPSFDVEIGEDLRVLTRSLHGTTVAVDLLSTGAAEQMAVLVRLATARLVGGDQGVPVILDDALGFTDPERLAAMGPAFAGLDESQILLLTCDPDRYRALPGATVLHLGTDGSTSHREPVAPPSATRRSRRRPPSRPELSLFDPDDLADDPRMPPLLNPVRAAAPDRTA